jgi:hypothetical protein
MDEYNNNPGLSPHARHILLAVIVIGILVALAVALTDTAGAQTTVANPTAAISAPVVTPDCPVPTPTPRPPTAISLQSFGATPAKLCRAWASTCTASRTILGVRVCTAWRFACTSKAPGAGKLSGLAAPIAGNRGGCGIRNRNMRYGITCNVSDAGPGFVSGACEDGYWFSRVRTRRSFTVEEIVTVDGCEGLNQELYAPIRISK